jgi:hypothetical protein
MGFGALTCASYYFDFGQVNPKDNVHLGLDDVPWNLLTPLILIVPSKIPPWNRKVDAYNVSIFDFAKKFLATNGVVLLFHLDDLYVLKEVRSYLESYR